MELSGGGSCWGRLTREDVFQGGPTLGLPRALDLQCIFDFEELIHDKKRKGQIENNEQDEIFE